MKRRFLLVFSVLFALLALTWTALLFAQADTIAKRFKQLDKNNDGKLSAEELNTQPAIAQLLKGADSDKDGFLTLQEVRLHLVRGAIKDKLGGSSNPSKESVREGPSPLAPGLVGVGRMIPDVPLKDIDGKEVSLSKIMGKNGLVIAMTNTSCPLCKKYAPTLSKLQETLTSKGLGMLLLNPTQNEKLADIRAIVQTHKLQSPYVHDADGSFCKTLATTSTAEVFLLDRQRTIVYRGAVDDQYGLGYSHDQAKRTYLLDAITALLAGKVPEPTATTAPGCELDLASAKALSTTITYHNRISRIIQANCAECHRKGGVGPFSLESYEDVVAHRGMIRKVVDKGTMPPWFAAGEKDKHSPWINDRSLPAKDREDLLTWLASDRPKGEPADAPLSRSFAQEGWAIGKPDVIFQLPKTVAIKATGTMPYQNITIETDLSEDRWVQALEVRPTARTVVHHVLVFALPPGAKEKKDRDEAADERAGFFAIYVPGNSTLVYPSGFAKKLPKGSRLRFQIHYTPDGTATSDQTQLGLVFAKEAPKHEVRVFGIVNPRLSIPPGAENHAETASVVAPTNVKVLAFLPHMHLRGKAFRYDVISDGKRQTILDIPRYDFNWQLLYRLAEPVTVGRGSKIEVTGWFDNSEKNPANPDPKKRVRWGPQTFDEMLLGYVEYYVTN
jgi:peroxiredoxin